MTTQEQIQKQFFDYLVKRRGLENVIHGTMEALLS